MSTYALEPPHDGIFHFNSRSGSGGSGGSTEDEDEDSEEDSSGFESKGSERWGGCHCKICSHDGACAIVSRPPLERELQHRNIVSGSKVLIVVVGALVFGEATIAVVIWISAHQMSHFLIAFGKLRIIFRGIVQAGTLVSLCTCLRLQRPSYALYLCTVFIWLSYNSIFWLFLPLEEMQKFAGNVHFFSKDESGYIALHGNMLLMFLLPLIIPEMRLMSLISRAWIGLFFLIILSQIARGAGDVSPEGRARRYRFNFDLTVGVLFLGAGFIIVSGRKRVLEEEQLAIFRLDQQKKGVSENMFNILGCMVPSFLLVPMLKDPEGMKPIAYNVERASVLFIMLANFEQMVTGTISPHQLLIILNRHFTQIDDVCESNGVTKIETVGCEYVCAVGVVPDDRVTDQRQGHHSILCKLVRVACRLLELQRRPQWRQEPVAFQMGIHTGPVVAGVVGRRLPRFRLFGDTVNTAARMMQRGMPGEVQFGVATREELPNWVALEERGQVEMKGKGLMTTYLLRPGHLRSPHPQAGAHGDSSPAVQGSGADMTRSLNLEPNMPPAVSGVGPLMSRGLTQMLLECAERDVATEEAGAQDAISFDDYLEELATGGSDLRLPKPLSFPSATHLVWSKRRLSNNEDAFRVWFHETWFCRSLVGRMRRLTKFFVGLFWLELTYLVCNRTNIMTEPLAVLREFRIFCLCRLASISILAAWLVIVGSCKWVQREAKLTQRLLLAFWCLLLSLVIVSYGSLPFLFKAIDNSRACSFPLSGLSRNVVFLDCFPVCMVLMMVHPFTFVQSCVFPVLMGVLVFFIEPKLPAPDPERTVAAPGDTQRVLNNVLVKIIFLISSMVCTVLACLQEANLRDRHQAQYTVNNARQKVEGILGNLLPPKVLEELHANSEARPQHHFSNATVVQSDLVGFTRLASIRDPADVVKIICDLFGIYDVLADKHDIYKVETVGDAYIAAQAEEPLSKTNSPLSMVLFGLDLVEATRRWARVRSEDVSCRVGVHTGECVGGVVGTNMQRYHLFGHLMTLLEVMESTAPSGRVHVSSACKRAVEMERLSRRDVHFPSEDVLFEERRGAQLSTSKGEVHSFAEVGGPTFLVCRTVPRMGSVDVDRHEEP